MASKFDVMLKLAELERGIEETKGWKREVISHRTLGTARNKWSRVFNGNKIVVTRHKSGLFEIDVNGDRIFRSEPQSTDLEDAYNLYNILKNPKKIERFAMLKLKKVM
jgi:hypothetical protein